MAPVPAPGFKQRRLRLLNQASAPYSAIWGTIFIGIYDMLVKGAHTGIRKMSEVKWASLNCRICND